MGKHWLQRTLAWGLAVLLFGPVQVAAQQAHDLPMVTVSFDMSAAPLYGDLPDQEQLADEMAAYLVEKLKGKVAFRFVRWHGASEAPMPADEVKASLTLQMVQEDLEIPGHTGAVPDTISVIHLELGGKTVKRALPDFKISEVLYDVGDTELHQHNPSRLKNHIRSTMDGWFESAGAEGFEIDLMQGFLRHVPLSEAVQVDEGNSFLIIPVRAEDPEMLDGTSVLRADFAAEKDGQAFPGEFTAVVENAVPLDADRVLYCMVQTFFYPHPFFQPPPLKVEGISAQEMHADYGPDIREILSEARLGSLTVYMESFRTFSSSHSDGLVRTR